jgi:hypothetical protein
MITVDTFLKIAEHEEAFDTESIDDYDGPNPPAVLRHFSSALQTCKYFRDTISNRVKLDGLRHVTVGAAPITALQGIRASNIWGISHILLMAGRGKDDGNLDILVQIAGVFWKNPFVLEDFDLLDELFFVLSPRDLTNLIPYLGEWISRAAVDSSRHKKHVHIGVYEDPDDDTFFVKLKCGQRAFMGGEVIHIFSIEGVFHEEVISSQSNDGENETDPENGGGSGDVRETESRDDGPQLTEVANEPVDLPGEEDESQDGLEHEHENEDEDEEENEDEPYSYWSDEELSDGEEFDYDRIGELRMVRDIEKSTSGTWWLIRGQGSKHFWFLVRYYLDEELGIPTCKIYTGPDGGSAYYWDPEYWECKCWPTNRSWNELGGSISGDEVEDSSED